MIQSPRAWYQLWCAICTSFGLQKLVTDGCVHIKYNSARYISTIWPGNSNICLSMIAFIPIVLTTRSSSSWSHTSTTTSSLQTAKPCAYSSQSTATRAFASTTKGQPAGTSAHNKTATQTREPSVPHKSCTSTNSWHAGKCLSAIRPRYLAPVNSTRF
jgi:hypothetical protein